MPEKAANLLPLNQWVSWSSSLRHFRVGVLAVLVFLATMAAYSLDEGTIKSFIRTWRFKQEYLTPMKVNLTQTPENQNFTGNISRVPLNLTENAANSSLFNEKNVTWHEYEFSEISIVNSTEVLEKLPKSHHKGTKESVSQILGWVSTELDPSLTKHLLARWLSPGGEPCRDSKTVDISIPGLDGMDLIELPAGEIHEFAFHALDESGNPRCLGGDFFETDLSGESWKSRPLVKDFGNGSYSVSLQVHPGFSGNYNLTVILLFRHFEGLRFSPTRFAFDRLLRQVPIKFYRTEAQLPEIHTCQQSDFSRGIWCGRWTRHGKNDDCEISEDGRYRCLPPDFPCQKPWCSGSLGLLESNGWVYSTHCSFRLFSANSAWNCLKNRWIFFWGDSNHVDTIRNMLGFILDRSDVLAVPRRFDMNFSNPKDLSQSVRITSIFNGHYNETQNYEGLNSLKDEGYRNLLKKYFSEDTVPDTIIMNSGLHDGVHWSNIRTFSVGATYAASFWAEVMDSVRQRGLPVPKLIYRSTIATGGYARTLAFNPNKMEAFNWVFLEKLREAGLVSSVIDNFDMTFPWHFDNRCNDGVHYGRGPAKTKWRDGEIGHQYFVDLMLAHILLNVLCAR